MDNTGMMGPWPDVATAFLFLSEMAGASGQGAVGSDQWSVDVAVLGEWLIRQGLGPLVYARCKESWPELATRLREDAFAAAAENSLHFDDLARVLEGLEAANIPVVLLKGAALAEGAYGGFSLRTMSDVDLWLRAGDMQRAVEVMQAGNHRGLPLRAREKEERPLELQFLSRGEIQFYSSRRLNGLLELHWSPFPGWWLRRTAMVDDEGIWQRTETLAAWGDSGLVRQLGAEDMVIQVAVHLAVNHQFGMSAVRGLVDIALTARARPVDWAVVAERARRWRVGTAVWVVLNLAEQLVGMAGADEVLGQLCPSAVRRALLRRLVSVESVLAGRDLRGGRRRYLLLLLLVDRPRDVIRLVFRTLWPERDWLEARYGPDANRWRHLWGVVRYGKV